MINSQIQNKQKVTSIDHPINYDLSMSRTVTPRRVLRLYRGILRTAKNWGNTEEKQWIRREVSEKFRKYQHVTNNEKINELYNIGEERHEVAKWSNIPYERPVHMGGGGAEGLSDHKQFPIISKGRKRVNMSGKTIWQSAFSESTPRN